MSLDQVCHMTGVGKTMIYRLIKDSGFPKQYKLSKKCSRWNRDEVIEWLESTRKEVIERD